jgi:hypothetical protein
MACETCRGESFVPDAAGLVAGEATADWVRMFAPSFAPQPPRPAGVVSQSRESIRFVHDVTPVEVSPQWLWHVTSNVVSTEHTAFTPRTSNLISSSANHDRHDMIAKFEPLAPFDYGAGTTGQRRMVLGLKSKQIASSMSTSM